MRLPEVRKRSEERSECRCSHDQLTGGTQKRKTQGRKRGRPPFVTHSSPHLNQRRLPTMRLARIAPLACLTLAVFASCSAAQGQEALFLDVSLDSKPAEVSSGAALVVTAKVGWRRVDSSGDKVWTRRGDIVETQLRYKAMWGPEKFIVMRPAAGTENGTDSPYLTVVAAIPPTELPPKGEMVRYWVVAQEKAGAKNSARKPNRDDEFYGAVVDASAIARESVLPTMHWFVKEPERARGDFPVQSFIAFDQSRGSDNAGDRKVRFYGQGVTARRRGSGRRGDPNMWGKGGTKDWPKRKFKLDFRGRDFRITWDSGKEYKVEEINLHSAYDEPGPESYLRETLAAASLERLGVPSSAAQHVVLRRNGVFYGLYVIVEQVDSSFLNRNGLDPKGALFKAVHWKLSNLRPPAPTWAPCRYDQEWELNWGPCPEVYRYAVDGEYSDSENDVQDANFHLAQLLEALKFVNEDQGTPTQVSDRLYSAVDVQSVTREMAAQTAMLHQDRCTKNYYVYRDPTDGKWQRIPWDMEDSFATDYRNKDARCDANGKTACRASSGTYCVQSCEWWNSIFFCDREHPQDIFTESDGRSTWNHLVNAVLKVPGSRAMYFAELKRAISLLHDDQWLVTKTKQLAASVLNDATRDAVVWKRNEPTVGRDALLRQIQERKDILVGEYGQYWA